MSLHCSMLSICCIKATVSSIRHVNWHNIRLLFSLINWQLMLVAGNASQTIPVQSSIHVLMFYYINYGHTILIAVRVLLVVY